MNKLACEMNVQVQDFNESQAKKAAQLEPAAKTQLEPCQLELVGGGEMIVCW